MFFVLAFPAFADEVDISFDYDFVDRQTYDENFVDGSVDGEGMDVLNELAVAPYDFLDQVEYTEGFDAAMNGTIETFNLTSTTTRGRAAVYIVMARNRMLLTEGLIPSNRFDDVHVNSWYFPAVAWAANQNWVLGLAGTNRFNPNTNVTRQEFAVMLVRVFSTPLHTGTQLDRFSDRNQIASWAVPYVRRAVERGWILGFPDGTFRPTNNITRQDAITMTNRTPGRDISDPVVQTIIWDQRGGTNVVNWQRAQGHALSALPTTTWSGRTFRGWNTTCGRYARGGAVATTTIVPTATAMAVTYDARWHDPIPRVNGVNNHNGRRHMLEWYRSSTVNLRLPTTDAVWLNAINDAATSWRNSATPIDVRFTTNSNNRVLIRGANPDSQTTLGSFRRIVYSGTTLSQFEIWIYTDTITAHANARQGYTVRNVAASVWAHEIGHAVGLSDNPTGTTNAQSLMRTGRSRNNIRGPQPFDRQSVNWLYR